MSNAAQPLVDALKAAAELCGILMHHLTEQGFSRKEALALTQTYLQTLTKPKSKEEN